MTPAEKKRLDMIPDVLWQSIKKQSKNGNISHKVQTITNYTTPTKLKAVIRWRERMARGGITTSQLAEYVGKSPTRLSEWLYFTHEPREQAFNEIEAALYEMGV
ncbi:MAG: hypothetical protein RBT70_08695 [Alphaproteobacteria bacterium]|nr:hypothetical protein [Alphaproteobacteria bacterium]